MQLVQGNIWNNQSLSYICITTNSIVKANGNLTMGAGIAKEANDRVSGLAKDLGKQIKARDLEGKFYGLLLSKEKYIAFQTKLHWKEDSPIEVVTKSIDMLRRLALKYPNKTFGLPFPGIQNGGLKPKDVLPLLQVLPNNVLVYHLKPL